MTGWTIESDGDSNASSMNKESPLEYALREIYSL